MMILAFRFAEPPPADTLRGSLHRELGAARLADLELEWSPRIGPRGAVAPDCVSVCSMDIVALVYAQKVCLGLGGRSVSLFSLDETTVDLPDWARTPWVDFGWLARLRIRLGSIRLSSRARE